MRRAFDIAAAAWSASARTRAIWDASNAPCRALKAPSAPKTVSPLAIGAATIERMPMSATTRSVPSACLIAGSAR